MTQSRLLIQQGKADEASAICSGILQRSPDDAAALILLAEISASKGDRSKAIELYTKLIGVAPEHAVAHYKRANLRKDTGQAAQALEDYNRAVTLDPAYTHAYCNRGALLASLDRPLDALEDFDKAIALNGQDYFAHYNRSEVLRILGRKQAALSSYDQAISLRPDYAEAHCNRATLLVELERADEALSGYEQALLYNPELLPALLGRGAQRQKHRQWDAALQDFDRAITLDPKYADAYFNRGMLFKDLKRWKDAIASFDQAEALKTAFPEALCARAALHAELGEGKEAVKYFDRAIALKPDYADALQQRADLLVQFRQYLPAIADYTEVLRIKPDASFVPGMLRYARLQICDWEDLQEDIAMLAQSLQEGKRVSPPFLPLAIFDSRSLQRRGAEIWVQSQCPPNAALGTLPPRTRGEKLKVAYFSADFREHAVSLLTAELFEVHDRSRFEIIGIAFGAHSGDAMRGRLKRSFDRFFEVSDQSDAEVALLARRLGVDIAVDLGGYTGASRSNIFALRAAPLQVGYLGYLGTMGASYMDYLIADHVIICANEEDDYAEKIIYLPHYQVTDSTRAVPSRIFTRAELGLPAEGFVFCCFNSNYKILPATFAVWMQILHRVEGSVLFLYAENPEGAKNLVQEAVRHGIDSARLVFGERVSVADYLARLGSMDLFLDTAPYNAGTTASDALWVGLPVITCKGQSFPSRIAASVLTAAELQPLIAATMDEYAELAVELATNGEKLAQLKDHLSHGRRRLPLFDTRGFARDLEAAYLLAADRHFSGAPPDHLRVG